MKRQTLLLLTIGLSIAADSLAQTITDNPPLIENNIEIKESEYINDQETQQNEVEVVTEELFPPSLNFDATIITNEEENVIAVADETKTNFEEISDVIVPNTEVTFLQDPQELNLQVPEGSNVEIIPIRGDDYQYNDVIHRDPNEIMDTAAGFVPVPIFKRRQKPRKQIATRRRFRPYPYRRYYYFYPYYRFYRPSSLRFY